MIRHRTAEVLAALALIVGALLGAQIGRADERARWQDGTNTTAPAECVAWR